MDNDAGSQDGEVTLMTHGAKAESVLLPGWEGVFPLSFRGKWRAVWKKNAARLCRDHRARRRLFISFAQSPHGL